MPWYDSHHFQKDPYDHLDPYKIDPKFLIWDRDDLADERRKVKSFYQDISSGRRSGLRIYGPAGSGKTWLTRLVEKEAKEGSPELAYVYTKVPRMEPTFQIVYRIAVEHVLQHYSSQLAAKVQQTTSPSIPSEPDWIGTLGDEDLGKVLSREASRQKRVLARKWIKGDKLTAGELNELDLSYSLDSDYDRYEMLRRILEMLIKVLGKATFVIDELENASVRLAGQLSDGLRDMLDSFSERLSMVCSFTAEKLDEWYDLGYSEALGRRLDYTIALISLSHDHVADFLRKHHKAYRTPGHSVPDQIDPFTSDGAVALLEQMDLGRHYPGFFLPNCRDLAMIAGQSPINKQFATQNFKSVTFK